MNRNVFCLILFLVIGYLTYAQESVQTNRVIIKLKKGVDSSNAMISNQLITGNNKVDRISQRNHAVKTKKIPIGSDGQESIYVIQFPNEVTIDQAINEFSNMDEIEYAEPDYIGSGCGVPGFTPNDTYFSRQWGLMNDGTFSLSPSIVGADIDMIKAWSITQGDSSITVGIIDTGNKLDHPEFSGRIWRNKKEIPTNGVDDDQNGYVDDVQGWDFVNSDNDPTDDYGHGTNVTGILGATGNNSLGYAGVDWNCKLMVLKAIDEDNFGYYSWFASAMYYAVNNGAKVINMSLGGTSPSSTLSNAVDYALAHNVTVVASMMNSNSSVIGYPAGIPGVIAVGSTNSDDSRTNPFFWSSTSGSSYGSHISVVAPGNYIYGLNFLSSTNYYTYWGGTSQATPLVSGLVSLLLSQDPTRTPKQVRTIIETTAEDQVGNPSEDLLGWDQYYGYGRINAYNALSVSTNIKGQEQQTGKLTISPNPFSSRTTIVSDTSFDNATLTVLNNLGQQVAVLRNINGQTISFSREYLDSGVYFFVFTQNNRVYSINKVIITD